MRVNAERSAGLSAFTMAALMLAVFTVSIDVGVLLPVLPFRIERLQRAREAAQVLRHAGLLSDGYTLSLCLLAPVWGRLSDRRGPRGAWSRAVQGAA